MELEVNKAELLCSRCESQRIGNDKGGNSGNFLKYDREKLGSDTGRRGVSNSS